MSDMLNITIDRKDVDFEVKASGRIDTTTAPQFEESLSEAKENAGSIVLDFTEIDYISSAGLRVVLGTNKAMLKKGGSLVVKNLSSEVKEIFEITGFSNILHIE